MYVGMGVGRVEWKGEGRVVVVVRLVWKRGRMDGWMDGWMDEWMNE